MSKRADNDMRCPNLSFDRKLSKANSFRVTEYGPAWFKIEGLVKINDQSAVVPIAALCSNVRGHGTRGADVRYAMRLDEERIGLESAVFVDAEGNPANLPRMGIVLVDIPSTAAWVKRFEEPAK